jgi:catechol 2,3-dioxygenase-like lactoylglutathione lyase family enzyme
MSTEIRPLEEIDHVQLPVPSTDTAVAWYTTHLGFTLDLQREDLAIVQLPAGPSLFLWRTQDATTGNFTRNGEPMPSIGIRTRDVKRLHARLQRLGMQITVYQDEGFGVVLKFYDPFGNLLVVYEPHHPPASQPA